MRKARLYVLLEGTSRVRVEKQLLTMAPLSTLLIPSSVRQIFNDTPVDALWLIVGAPAEPANTLEMTPGLVAVDRAYELVRCEQRGGGWCLVVRRICGARARAEARKSGTHRHPGIAAGVQQRQSERAEHLIVRETIRRELAA